MSNLQKPRIAIIGAGAVGGYYGAKMVQAGHEVHFLLRSDYEWVRQHGWIIQSVNGDFSLSPEELNLHCHTASMPTADLLIVTLKATGNDALRQILPPVVGKDTVLLTLQNGLGNEELLAELFGAAQVMGGLAFVCTNRAGPGVIHHMDHGLIRIGEFDPSNPHTDPQRIHQVCRLFQSSRVRCEVLQDLKHGRWTKLIWNVPFNGLGAALDLNTQQLLNTPEGELLVRRLMAEAISIGESLGLAFPSGIIDQQIQSTHSMGPYRTSMQIDRQEGRKMETDAILKRPLDIGRQIGLECPELSNLCTLLSVVDGALGNKAGPGVQH